MMTPTKGSLFESISDIRNTLYVSTSNLAQSGTDGLTRTTTMLPLYSDVSEIDPTFTYPPTVPPNFMESVTPLTSPSASKGNLGSLDSEIRNKDYEQVHIESVEHNSICGVVWLQNKTLSTIKKYKKRFLSLQRKKLQIFRNDLEFKPTFTIDLNSAVIIPTKPKKFHIQTAKKIFKFKCISEEERQEWLHHLIREKKEKNVEQIRETIINRMNSWNSEQIQILESIQNVNKGANSPISTATPVFDTGLQRLVFKPLSLVGFREEHKSIPLLTFLTHEEFYCFLTKTLRDLALVTRKQVFAKSIHVIIGSSKDTTSRSYVDSEGELGIVIKDGYLYPNQCTIEKLLGWQFDISEKLNNHALELKNIIQNLDDSDSDLTDDDSFLHVSTKYKSLEVRLALTEVDNELDEELIIANIQRFVEYFQELKKHDSVIYRITTDVIGKVLVSNYTISLFTKRGDKLIDNYPADNPELLITLANSPRVQEIIIKYKITKLEEILQEEIIKSEQVLGKRIIFSLGGDIRSRVTSKLVSSDVPKLGGVNISENKIQLTFLLLIQRLIDEVPDRYQFKSMRHIDEVVISMQSTKIQENMLVDGVIESKGRFQLSAEELKLTLKERNKERKKIANSFATTKHLTIPETPDTTSEVTSTNRDSVSEISDTLLEVTTVEGDSDENIQEQLKKNFSKKFPLKEHEIDQIVDEALKQIRKMWQNPSTDAELLQFIHDYIELVDIDQSFTEKLFHIILEKKRLHSQEEIEFRTVALCLLKETLPQIVYDNLSRRRDIVLFGMKQSGKTQLLYKLKLNKNIKTNPSVGIQQEVIAFQDLNLMLYDIGGQSKEKDALKHFTKQRHERLDGLIFMIDASTYNQTKDATISLLQLFVKYIMKVNQTANPSNQALGVEHRDEVSSTIPLLIFLNKTDITNSVDEEILLESLDPLLEKFFTKWNIHTKVQSCSVIRGDGLFEGLQYLYDTLIRRDREKSDAS